MSSFWPYLFLLCFSRQASHLICCRVVGFLQSLQSLRDLAFARFALALRRCCSFRSGVCALISSYFRLFSALALICAGSGSGWRSVWCVFGVAFLGSFLACGFWAGFLRFGFDRSMVCWKSCLSGWCTPTGNGRALERPARFGHGMGWLAQKPSFYGGPGLLTMVKLSPT